LFIFYREEAWKGRVDEWGFLGLGGLVFFLTVASMKWIFNAILGEKVLDNRK